MPRGDKSSYTSRQKRKAEHIEEGYERRGIKPKEAKRRAWATVNKQEGGGKRKTSRRGGSSNRSTNRTGRRSGGRKAKSK